MTWSAPMTAIAGATFSAAQFNQFVRDNLNETAPAKATASGQIFVSTGPNAIAARTPTAAATAASQSTATTSYVDLATVGPTVTVTTGTSALAFMAARISNSGANTSWASVAVSGSSSVAASDAWAAENQGTDIVVSTRGHLFTGLNAGSNTFTAKYKAGGSTATFVDRELIVIPL